MTTNSLQLNTSTPWAGLGTATYNVPAAGLYTINVVATLPFSQGTYNTTQAQPAISNLQIVMNQNGTPVLTVGGASPSFPSPTQTEMNAGFTFQCALNDVLTVVFSSTAAVDNNPNAVKANINLFFA